MDETFWYTHLRVDGRAWQPVWSTVGGDVRAELDASGHEVWGVFSGLFGLASYELIAICRGPDVSAPSFDALPGDVVEQRQLVPTARPVAPFAPLARRGLYVLRTFEGLTADLVDEVVELSAGAWTTFEVDEGWESEPVGLFTSALPGAPIDRMLLVTWYDGFGSWERSRTPDPEARDRFVRRHMLTQGTAAIATSLVEV